jgi:uncharacterized membrane protein
MKPWLLVSMTVTVLVLAASLFVYIDRAEWLPEKVPTHWNARNEVDKVTPRDDMLVPLLLMPGVMVLMIGLAVILPWVSPQHFKVEPFRATWDYIMALMVCMFGYMSLVMLAAYTETVRELDFIRWLLGGLLVFLGMLGNRLGKVQRNFWMGIRTPWTLASDTVWIRTHRLAAWLFVSGAVIGLALLLAGVNPILCLGAFIVAAIIPVFYSLWLYKHLEKTGKLDKSDIPAPTP